MRYAVLVCGPAGAGKSTFANALITHGQTLGRTMHLFNLDPAAEEFEHEPAIDIKDLISLEDVMEDLDLGPNGGLLYCFEYLMENLDWLHDSLGSYESDYLIIDMPGQIELYTSHPFLPRLIRLLSQNLSFQICATYLLESQFTADRPKFFAGVLAATAAMINLEVPCLNLLSKMDLVKTGREGGKRGRELERYLDADPDLMIGEANAVTNPKFHRLNEAIVGLIEDFNMVSFLPLDVTDEESLGVVLSHVDNAMQFGEHEEPREPAEGELGDEL